jgi:hypothetical protein
MSIPRYHGRAAFDPTIVAAIAGVLRSHWDQDGALARAAVASLSQDQTLPKTYEAFATAIAGLLAAGGSEAEVSRYLRLEEERLLGAARSTGHTRWPIARFAWRAVRDLDPAIPPVHSAERSAIPIARFVLFEIALQSDAGGASRDTVREGVDYRRKLRLADAELDTGLRRLQDAGLIEPVGQLYKLTSDTIRMLPRTPRGAVSTRAELWRRLYERVLPD